MTRYEARRAMGFRMKRLREIAGVDAALVCKKLGISLPHLEGIEAGQLPIECDALMVLGKIYKVHPFYLISEAFPIAKSMHVPALIRTLAQHVKFLKSIISLVPMLEPMLRNVADLDHATDAALETTKFFANEEGV